MYGPGSGQDAAAVRAGYRIRAGFGSHTAGFGSLQRPRRSFLQQFLGHCSVLPPHRLFRRLTSTPISPHPRRPRLAGLPAVPGGPASCARSHDWVHIFNSPSLPPSSPPHPFPLSISIPIRHSQLACLSIPAFAFSDRSLIGQESVLALNGPSSRAQACTQRQHSNARLDSTAAKSFSAPPASRRKPLSFARRRAIAAA